MSTIGTDAQIDTLAELLIACGAADDPPDLLRAAVVEYLDIITLGWGDDVFERVAEMALPSRTRPH